MQKWVNTNLILYCICRWIYPKCTWLDPSVVDFGGPSILHFGSIIGILNIIAMHLPRCIVYRWVLRTSQFYSLVTSTLTFSKTQNTVLVISLTLKFWKFLLAPPKADLQFHQIYFQVFFQHRDKCHLNYIYRITHNRWVRNFICLHFCTLHDTFLL